MDLHRLVASAFALFATPLFLVPAALAQSSQGLAPSEWTSLRSAYEQGRHRVFERGEGDHRARTHRERFVTAFDGRGASVTADGSAWTFGLELVRYGFDGREVEVTEPQRTVVDGRRLSYAWDDVVTEWYVNRDDGLEHGFTVRERPQGSGSDGELQFDLRVLGDLAPSVDPDGLGVSLFDGRGTLAATYAGLVVTDALGRPLEARMSPSSEGLSILVRDTGATYPLTIDPVVQQAYLKSSNTELSDQFGSSVAISGDTVVVGAVGEDSGSGGVNGDQSDNSATFAGAAYVFVRSGATWTQQAYLKASNAGANDAFGRSVSISGDTIVIGAIGEGSNATGIDGDQTNNAFSTAGAAYVFVRTGTTWTQQAYLKASNTDLGDRFGSAVAVTGDTVVVGANSEDGGATGVNGDQASIASSGSGAAYVFVRSGATWTQQAYLKASNTGPADFFGSSATASGDTIVVGANFEDSSATGIDGAGADDSADKAGAAYVFARVGTTWSQQAYLKASNTEAGDSFGSSVAISGETVLVGAYFEDSSATGIDGDQADNGAILAGAAYVFVRSGATWTQQAYLKASNTGQIDFFGSSVAVSGDRAAVGAFREASAATGVDGDQGDDTAAESGAVYTFVRSGASWVQEAYLKASNTDPNDQFGGAVALSGTTIVIGAFGEDSNATGIDGDQANDSVSGAGAAYIIDLDPDWRLVPGCFGNTAAYVVPSVPAQINTTVFIDLLGSVVNNGVVATYYGALGVDGAGCGFQLSPTEEMLLAFTPSPTYYGLSGMTGGLATIPFTLPNKPGFVGLRVTLQSVAIDTTTFASEFGNALEFVIRP